MDEARAALDPAELEFASDYWTLASWATCTTTRQERAAREAGAGRKAEGGDFEVIALAARLAKQKLLAARGRRPSRL